MSSTPTRPLRASKGLIANPCAAQFPGKLRAHVVMTRALVKRAWLLLAWPLLSAPAFCAIDAFEYQLPMAHAPATGAEAISSLADRQAQVMAAMACGSEISFGRHYLSGANNEDIAGEILGKLAWFQRSAPVFATQTPPAQPCVFTVLAKHDQVCALFEADCRSDDTGKRDTAATAFLTNPAWTQLRTGFASQLRLRFITFLPTACNDLSGAQIAIAAAPGSEPKTAQLTFTISPSCLIAEVNAALMRMDRGNKQVGSAGVPCHYFWSTEGDWDSTLKVLIRVAELDRRRPSLSAEARKHLNDTVIDIDGGPAQERYPLWECGNEEKSVGDPKARSDDRDGVDGLLDDIWDSGWDVVWMLLALLVFFLLLLWLAFVVFGALVGGLLVLGAAALAAAGVFLITIPESENHLWMINSTKYLNNQYLIANGGTGYGGDQGALRKWFLAEFQKIAKADFIEYNSRPYARYSLVSIANLADFAGDDKIRTGARAILEYSIAKYAITSSEGRRIAPFRRKREDMPRIDGIPRDGTALSTSDPPKNGLFDLISGSDHLHAVGLYYFGLSQNLPGFGTAPHAATTAGYATHAINYATSNYLPDAATYALAIERQNAPLVHQRLHHHGYEAVSSGKSFTITAGGLTTGIAKAVTVNVIDKFFKEDDVGAAVPTTLMLAGAPDLAPDFKPRAAATRRSTLDRFLRFEGERPGATDTYPSYDRNLCIWDGFACGVNPRFPDDLQAPCMAAGPRDGWFFVRSDSADCAAYAGAPLFWIAIYHKALLGSDKSGWGSVYGYGLLEIVDGTEMGFEEFKARVLQRNPGPGAPMSFSGDCSGTYVSARGPTGQRIEFSCDRVTTVDGSSQPEPADWPHAGAPAGAIGTAPMQSSGSGKIEITSAVAKRKLVLNFEDSDDPRFDAVVMP
jgi:hypothetical protein